MQVTPIKAEIFTEGMDLIDYIDRSVDKSLIQENMILAITSKVVSIAEKRFVSAEGITKEQLVKQEADEYLGEMAYDTHLTVKHGLLIASAGIDESNVAGKGYLLFPEDPFDSARRLGVKLSEKWQIKNLGIILTDSHTAPLRRGVTGICLAYWGFKPIDDCRGGKDLYQRRIEYTTVNVADALATAATFVMGETDNQKPLAQITEVDVSWTRKVDPSELCISLSEDLYAPLFTK